jgi:serine protease
MALLHRFVARSCMRAAAALVLMSALLLPACGGGGGEDPPAPTLSLGATPATVTVGGSVAISWSAANANTCAASGAWSGTRATAGSENFSPVSAATLSFMLTCTGAGGSIARSAVVTVNAAPLPSVALTASPAAVTVGSSFTLAWTSTNANTCTASGAWNGARATSGSEILVAASASTPTYTLACTGPGGVTTQSAVVTITPAAPVTPTVTLTANPTALTPRDVFRLTWSSTNATSCAASGSWTGTRATSGTTSFTAGSTATTYSFTLTCTGAGGSGAQTVTVPLTLNGATLSGKLLVTANTQTDSDTNDALSTLTSNNTPATAQPLPTTVVLGGYVNEAGAGPDGPLKTSGDPFDYFSVSLIAGQVIELGFNDAVANDIDLTLAQPDGTVVDVSVGTGTVERITVQASGNYRILVEAFEGASNYILTIGQQGPASASDAARLSSDFVPGELLVGTPRASPGVQAAAAAGVGSSHGLAVGYHSPGGYSLLKLGDQRVRALAAGGESLAAGHAGTRYRNATDKLKVETLLALKALRRDPQVAWAEVNRIAHASAVPNDPYYFNQRWHYEQISLPDAWNVTTGSNSVIVAVIDSGVRAHADLAARLVSGYDFATVSPGDGGGDDTDASDPGEPVGGGYSFHGTHVAGTIGAAGNNGAGVSGVAWTVRIMPVRALGTTGSGSSTDIVEGIRYAAGLVNRSGTVPAQRADIINLSLGGPGSCSTAFANAIAAARAAGVIVVAAAGNEASGSNIPVAASPANCAGAIGVSAVNRSRTRASYSNAGAGVDVAAPGGDSADQIFSTWANYNGTSYTDSVAGIVGTSMATPHVAGVLALMKSVNASLTPDMVDNLLASGALTDDIGPAGADDLGIGLINAFKAVVAASGGSTVIPGQLGVSTTSLNFGDAATSSDVTVRNSGTEPVSATGATSSAPWLTATAVQVNASGLGTYRINVSRAALAAGSYSGYVEFTGNTGSPVRVNVLVEVRASTLQPFAGVHYLLLYDAATRATRKSLPLLAQGAEISYQFLGVQPGTYGLIAGTDLDHDLFICDPNEACTTYPVYGDSQAIQVGTVSITGIDLPTAYRPNYGESSSSFAGGKAAGTMVAPVKR